MVVPTFREVENIPALAARVAAVLSPSGREWELLLSDDDSGDGSESVVAALAARLPIRIAVRRGRPRDLSLAVLDGIRGARFDLVCVMDADLSHPPERMPELLALLDDGCDLAVGSRYVPGAEIAADWGLFRRLNSRAATLLARPLARCADPMSGFFAADRRRLPDPRRLRPLGYKIGLELMVRGRLRVREAPIAFRDRSRGASKLNWRQQWNALRHLGRLYRFRFPRMVRGLSFGLVGASGFVVDSACYFGAQWLGAHHLLARFLSFWPAVSWNWWWNRLLTFADRPTGPRAAQWRRFALASAAGLLVNFGTYWLLTAAVAFFARERFAALVIGVVAGSVFNFAVANRFVYGERPAAPSP